MDEDRTKLEARLVRLGAARLAAELLDLAAEDSDVDRRAFAEELRHRHARKYAFWRRVEG